jgi:hypothetical protein
MEGAPMISTVWVSRGLGLGSIVLIALGAAASETRFVPFESVLIDSRMAGDCKMAGDIDGDGRVDLVVAGGKDEGLVWYRNPGWQKFLIAIPSVEFSTEGQLADINRDSHLDIIVADGNGPGNLLWFENPHGRQHASRSDWVRHTIGSIDGWANDLKVADVDGDGRLDILVHSTDRVIIFFQGADESWTKAVFQLGEGGEHGLGVGDLNGDGRPDLVVRPGRWLENPGGFAAREPGAWGSHPIGQFPKTFKAEVADLAQDGRAGVVVSAPESDGDLLWWTHAGDPSGSWSARPITQDLPLAHTLQIADMDGDGRPDIVGAQMHTSAQRRVMVFYNRDRGQRWDAQIVDTGGLHNSIVADVNGDGRPDIFGSNYSGNPGVRLWLNAGKGPGAPLSGRQH